MQVTLATLPAAPGRDNEDFVGTIPDGVVLIDGAGSAGADSGCRHGVAWYSHRLGTGILSALAGGLRPRDALRAAISGVADLHRDTCDLSHPGTPSATVIVTSVRGSALDYLVLADSVLLLRNGDEVCAVSDEREADVGARYRADMDATPNGTAEHDQALTRYITAMRDHRNRPGGFWVASTDPDSADEAISDSVPLADLDAFALLSDGASRLADRFGLTDWTGILRILHESGPATLIRQTRDAEHGDPDGSRWPRGKAYDDATAAYVAF